MLNQLIAVVDAVRARFYAVGQRKTPHGDLRRELEELASLENPALEDLTQSEGQPGLRHHVNDRKDAHTAEVERRFATSVLARLAELMRKRKAERVILAAAPRMLGFLRHDRTRLPEASVWVLPKHLTELSAHDLRERLESEDLLAD